MTSTIQAPPDRRYAEVLAFYAHQLQLLDAARFDEYGATFTEAAELTHSPARRPPAHSRDEIVRAQVEGRRAAEGDPVQRRHWIGMVDLDESDGVLECTAYCLVVQIRSGEAPRFSSAVFHDVLVASAPSGDLRVRSRLIAHD